MDKQRRRYKLDWVSLSFLVAGVVFFISAGVFYGVTVYTLAVPPYIPPTLQLYEVANIFGLAGMIVIPMYILAAFTVEWRIRRRARKTGQDIDDNPKRGTAGSS